MVKRSRHLLRAIAFICIFAVLFCSMMWLCSNHPDHRYYQMIGGFYQEPEDSLDGVFIGSSNCYAYWNPLVAWENYGLTVYPFASGYQPFYAAEYLIREARKTQPDAVYIVGLNSVEADDLNAAAIHSLLNYMPNSENKTDLMNYLSDLLGYSRLERLEFRFPWIRIREYWNSMLVNGPVPKLDGLKGASKYDTYLEDSADISSAYIISEHREDLPDALVQSIESLLDYCDAEGVKVLFVAVPRAEMSETALGRINTASDIIRARGYDVLHLTDDADAVGMDLTQDYYNGKHANIHGSIKFTNYLSKYLAESYGLEDKRGDSAYGSWDEAWDKYTGIISAEILDIEVDGRHRAHDLDAPSGLTVSDDGGDALCALIRWEAVDGADGYLVYRRDGEGAAWQRIAECEETFYRDEDCLAGGRYDYRVVPLCASDGETYYGNFSYEGASIQLQP